MYSNGGYLMLDFKNSTLTSVSQKINGISFNTILNANKPIMITNVTVENKHILANYAVLGVGDKITLQVIGVTSPINNIVVRINIDKNDNVTGETGSIFVPSSNALNLESEVCTNASKSDSNTDK